MRARSQVKLVGWGVDNYPNGTKLPYWIGANSWCRQWGEGGFFRIVRGLNNSYSGGEVGIEAAVQSALPLVAPEPKAQCPRA